MKKIAKTNNTSTLSTKNQLANTKKTARSSNTSSLLKTNTKSLFNLKRE